MRQRRTEDVRRSFTRSNIYECSPLIIDRQGMLFAALVRPGRTTPSPKR
jgi:hypothetical protein